LRMAEGRREGIGNTLATAFGVGGAVPNWGFAPAGGSATRNPRKTG
jgi:hypothetical protein